MGGAADDAGDADVATAEGQVFGLLRSPALREHMKLMYEFLSKPPEQQVSANIRLGDTAEYRAILRSNDTIVEIGRAIHVVHQFIKDQFSPRFGELSRIVRNPLDYARAVFAIVAEPDLSSVGPALSGILPQASVLVIIVTASTSAGPPLAAEVAKKVSNACQAVLELDGMRNTILEFIRSRLCLLTVRVAGPSAPKGRPDRAGRPRGAMRRGASSTTKSRSRCRC